jgi:glycerophosphoryl diester phosphodiesterase
VNQPEDMKRLAGLPVDGIITDYPDRLLALLGR